MKQFKWLLLLVVFALVATACGDDDADDTTAAPSDTTVAAETTAAPDDGGTDTTAAPDTTEAMVDLSGTSVSIFSSEDGVDEATGIQRALDVFAAETGIEIKHSGARDFSEQINAQAVGGNPPDIAMFPQPGKVRDFASQGFLLPLPAAVDAAVRPQWPAGTLETYSVDGVAYAVQAKTDLKSIVWYNTQVFADGGYAIPTTLGELVTLGNTMITDGQTPWCIGIESGPATGWLFTDWMEDMMLRVEGPDAYDRWTSNELAFDDPSVIAVAQTILDIWNTPGNTYAAGGSIAATAHSADHGDPLAAVGEGIPSCSPRNMSRPPLIDDTFAEAFPMMATRLIITAADEIFVKTAATEFCGNASSVIGCNCEAAVERFLVPDETIDGRPGVAILAFAFDQASLQKAVSN